MARLRLENEDDCVDDDGRGMTVMWHLPTSELHGVGGPWGEKDEQLIILIPPTIHVDKKRSSSVFRGWSENEGKCCYVWGLKRRSPHNMEGVVRLAPLSHSRGLPCGWQGVKVPRKHGGHLCRQKLSMSWLWIQISL